MFAIVRTGGKQYRVSPGDKIVVEKLAGEAGDSVTLGDVLLAGEGSDLKGTDGLTVAAEIIAQAKGEKVVVFKKRRRHNYRRKNGHRQQHTILKIVSVGGQSEQKSAEATDSDTKKAPKKAKAAPAPAEIDESQVASSEGVVPADAGTEATQDVTNSTQDAAPAKGKAKKTPKA
ncbi:50S ribosomal protein L21 [Sphingomonas kaistensis]|uniref:50S ribosomal protein L21 n=1 Tax=Sphingomonas kaistensis TaxID=298708 RepID=UPI003CC8B684